MAVRLTPAQVHLGRFDPFVRSCLSGIAETGGAVLSARARDRMEAALRREVIRVAGFALGAVRDHLAAGGNPFAAANPALIPQSKREEASALLLEQLNSGETALPEGMEEAVRSRLDLLAAALKEMLSCLAENRQEIGNALFDGHAFTEIQDLRIGAGDFHRGARAAAIVFTDAGRLVFKPRDCTADLRAAAFAAKYFPDSVIIPKGFTDGKRFGVFEYLEKQIAEDDAGARRWYRAMGETAVLFHVLGSRDMNMENILACRGLPALIDLETLMSPQITEDAPLCERFSFSERLARTPWVSCLLYRKQENLQFSPLFSEDAEKGCLPRVNGRPADVREYRKCFLDGMAQAYNRCLERREELLRDIRAFFGELPFRLILRDSQSYMKLLEQAAARLFGPDAAAFRGWLAKILQASGKVLDQGVLDAEYRALLRWDIPWFAAKGSVLTDGLTEVSSGLIRTGAAEYAENRVRGMCREELDLILNSFSRSFDVVLRERKEGDPAPMPLRGEAPLPEEEALREAETLLLEIDSRRTVAPGNAAGWIVYDGTAGTPVAALPGMVYGTTGIGLFACAAETLSGKPEVRGAAARCMEIALEDLRLQFRALETGAIQPAEPDTGEAGGFGGILRCLALMNRLRPGLCGGLINDALCLLEHTDLSSVTRADRQLGLAGLVGTLARFPELHGTPAGKTVTERASDRLMALRGFQEGSFTLWKTVSPRHLISGAGHGMAGIAEALFGAGRLLNREDLIRAAGDAMDYERRIFDPEKGTWPDNRLLPDKGYMHGYCSGAPGIAVMQLRAPLPGTEAFPELARHAVETFPLLYRDHLCCGNGALAECELSSGRRESAGRILAGIVRRKKDLGHYTTRHVRYEENSDPSLFFGLAGIGYQFLRYADPDRVLSVL